MEMPRHGNRGKTVGLHSGKLGVKRLFTVRGGLLSTVSVLWSAFSFAEKYVEAIWVDLVVHNPFNAEVNLSELTVIVTGFPSGSEWSPELVDVEILDEIILDPKETRTVNIAGLFNRLVQANLLGLRSHYQFWQDSQ